MASSRDWTHDVTGELASGAVDPRSAFNSWSSLWATKGKIY
jgi:hypothetical protein